MKVTKAFKNSGSMSVKVSADDGAGFSNSVQSKNFNLLVNNQPIIVTKTFIRSNSQTILLDASQSYDIDGQALKFDRLLSDGTHRHDASFYWEAPRGGVHFITLTVDDGQGKKNSIARECAEPAAGCVACSGRDRGIAIEFREILATAAVANRRAGCNPG